MEQVLIELVVPIGLSSDAALGEAQQCLPGVRVDQTYKPISMLAPTQHRELGATQQIIVIRGVLENTTLDRLKAAPGVIQVVRNVRSDSFGGGDLRPSEF